MTLLLDPEADIILCHEHDAMYMEEFLDFMVTLTTPAIRLVRYLQEEDFSPYTNLRCICVRRIPEGLLHDLTARVVFVNTEQLTAPRNMAEFQHFTRRADIHTFDYSKANIRMSGQSRHFFFPLLENAAETERLRAMILSSKVTHDVAVVGTPTTRRFGVLEELYKAGLDVVFIQGFGESRDRRIAECKVLLNLHAFAEFVLYEPLRCDRWVHAGMTVVTEPCLDMDAIPAGVRTTPSHSAADIVATLRAVLMEKYV